MADERDKPTRARRGIGWGSLILRALLCLVLGVVINILVAWGFMAFHAPTGTTSEYVMKERRWPVRSLDTLGRPVAWMAENATGFASWTIIEGTLHAPPTAPPATTFSVPQPVRIMFGTEVKAEACGWPRLSMVRWSEPSIPVTFWSDGIDISGMKRAMPSIVEPRLPIHPLWGGFIANALVFALPAAAVLLAPAVVRLLRRARRGVCLGCGYDARGLQRCPECGRAVRGPS